MTTHGINHTCKHDFINLEHLSSLHNHILIVIFCCIYSLTINPITIFKSDVILMEYVIRVKPFDV